MGYCIISDLFFQIDKNILLDHSRDDESEDENMINGKLEQAIENASFEINSYLMKKYTVPLSPLDPLANTIKKICIDISIYNIISRKGFHTKDSNEMVIWERYKQAIKTLENLISDNKSSTTYSSIPIIKSPGKTFGDLSGF